MLTYVNHLDLFSEEIGLTRGQLGNYPLAFTHLALIDAATTLDAALTDAARRNRVVVATPMSLAAKGSAATIDDSGTG